MPAIRVRGNLWHQISNWEEEQCPKMILANYLRQKTQDMRQKTQGRDWTYY